MKVNDVKRTVDATGLQKEQAPKLLSDNGSCYIESELKSYLKEEHPRNKFMEKLPIRKPGEKSSFTTEQ